MKIKFLVNINDIYMTTSQKILICGFPHSGTSILKSIIGHIEEVEEICNEINVINQISNKKFILCKFPFTSDAFFGEEYKDYIKIFIIRNPLFVFSSLNKRFNYETIPDCHNFHQYINTLTNFIKYKNNPEKNIYTVKYEDLFKNNYDELKKILNDIGLQYDDNIFNNSKYTNVIINGVQLVDEKPPNNNHDVYRTWQINQPFISNNDISKIDLNDEQKEEIINNSYVLQIYPDINSSFYMFKGVNDEQKEEIINNSYVLQIYPDINTPFYMFKGVNVHRCKCSRCKCSRCKCSRV